MKRIEAAVGAPAAYYGFSHLCGVTFCSFLLEKDERAALLFF